MGMQKDELLGLASLFGAIFQRRKIGRVLTAVSNLVFLTDQLHAVKVRIKAAGLNGETGIRLSPEEVQNVAAVFDLVTELSSVVKDIR